MLCDQTIEDLTYENNADICHFGDFSFRNGFRSRGSHKPRCHTCFRPRGGHRPGKLAEAHNVRKAEGQDDFVDAFLKELIAGAATGGEIFASGFWKVQA